MTLAALSPREVQKLMMEGALLVDIRDEDEYARQHIADAVHCPLAAVDESDLGNATLIFHCRSGNRTEMNAQRLAAKGRGDVYVMAGGLDAWRRAGLPVVADRKAPLELMRQVQIAAGGMILLGTILAFIVSPWFLLLPAFAGGGLMTAGLTGFCGMARLLMKAPWNRRAAA